MSQENVEIVRDYLDAVTAVMRGELTGEAVAEHELFDPQFELHWHDQRTFPDQPQHLRRAEVIRWSEDVRETMDEFALEPLEFIEAPGDRVLILIRQSGRGRESSVPIVTHFFALYTIRDGKVRKGEIFRHRAEALEAAGLRE
jgi:hypothetical protein